MIAFLGKLSKNGLLYAFIGIFVVGGVILPSAKAQAATIFSVFGPQTPVYTDTYGNWIVQVSALASSQVGATFHWSYCFHNSTTGKLVSPIAVDYPTYTYGIGITSYLTSNGGQICGDGAGVPEYGSGSNFISGTTYGVGFLSGSDSSGYPNGNTYSMQAGDYLVLTDDDTVYSAVPTDTSTHFISVSPANGTTTATTSPVGASVHANPEDFPNYGRVHAHFTQESAFACQNSGAVYDAVGKCSGANAPASPIDIDFSTSTLNRLVSGDYTLSQTITFGGGGNWTGVFTIDQVSQPWYYLGLFSSYNTLVSTTTHFVIGSLSPMDIVRQAVASSSAAFASTTRTGIGAILASTTASLVNACNPFGGFNPGDCLTLTIWPGEQAVSDDFTIIKQTPPWGYIFRVIDLLNATTSTTTLPTIDYSFASTSPMAVMGNIHFDPFGSVAQAGALIGEMHSDQAGAPTVWTIMMPIVNIFVYLVLIFMILHDLTGIHWGGDKEHDETRD